MEMTTLGRTGLRVGVAGLGCGGSSSIGMGTGKSHKESVALVRTALDLGINLLDTAARYSTEAIVGEAIAAVPRDSFLISTKARAHEDGAEDPLPPAALIDGLEKSLRRLGTDTIDVFHVHGVLPQHYEYVREAVIPVLLAEKDKGKFRHLGITEYASIDTGQDMLARAVEDDCWDVIMVAFHMMNQKPRERIFPHSRRLGIGTLNMFAVRDIFSKPERLRDAMRELAADGRVLERFATSDDPLGFLVHAGGATSIMDAAYRFARHEPGVDVVLTGTGDPDHLRANVASILKPPLPAEDLATLRELFGDLAGVGLDPPKPLPSS
ncbi:MAG: aldo/keto reductase [Rhodospirillales bacterium]|nr:aldo/keto reductase [Rhodospirillales bacterium]